AGWLAERIYSREVQLARLVLVTRRRWDPVRLAVVALSQPHAGKLFAQHRNGEGPLRNLLRIAQDSLTAGGHSVCFRVYLRVVPGLYLAADVPVRQVPSRPGACRVRSQRVSTDRDSFGFVDRIGPGGSILPPDSGLAVLDNRRGVILCDSLHRPDWREPGARVHAHLRNDLWFFRRLDLR